MARPRLRADGAPLIHKFMLRVEKTQSCWLWTGPLKDNGYGKFSIGKSGVRAHRWIWEHTHGPIPRGVELRHTCDRFYAPGDATYRRCVNPDHLETGTHAENMADMTARGRQAAGERSSKCRLSDKDVADARSMRAAGMTVTSVARHFSYDPGSMSRVLRGIGRRSVR